MKICFSISIGRSCCSHCCCNFFFLEFSSCYSGHISFIIFSIRFVWMCFFSFLFIFISNFHLLAIFFFFGSFSEESPICSHFLLSLNLLIIVHEYCVRFRLRPVYNFIFATKCCILAKEKEKWKKKKIDCKYFRRKKRFLIDWHGNEKVQNIRKF